VCIHSVDGARALTRCLLQYIRVSCFIPSPPFAAPDVLRVEPPDVDPSSGGTVVLTGLHFGAGGSGPGAPSVSVTLVEAGVDASRVRVTDPHRKLEVVLPPLPPGCGVANSSA
jgi:hypothetical protein